MNLCLTHPPPSLFLSHCMFLSLAIKTRVAEVCGNRGGEAVKNQLKKASPLPHHATLCLGVQVLSDIQSRMLSPTSSDAAQQSTPETSTWSQQSPVSAAAAPPEAAAGRSPSAPLGPLAAGVLLKDSGALAVLSAAVSSAGSDFSVVPSSPSLSPAAMAADLPTRPDPIDRLAIKASVNSDGGVCGDGSSSAPPGTPLLALCGVRRSRKGPSPPLDCKPSAPRSGTRERWKVAFRRRLQVLLPAFR
eukprot:CAMPEP_0117690088 /NCGR_PEP_ID=MMETSP0804-20121206/24917_1 /TAXON_ID=1074897 /ORGANISM="Tetraselmis astigmatica, Strain CCMP880" /LENGTH=245 /DNA_ID=CAMNT_0005503065 /DNA_START=41 /DNA_END=777 /DNA_ORIENTATION=+